MIAFECKVFWTLNFSVTALKQAFFIAFSFGYLEAFSWCKEVYHILKSLDSLVEINTQFLFI